MPFLYPLYRGPTTAQLNELRPLNPRFYYSRFIFSTFTIAADDSDSFFTGFTILNMILNVG